MVLIRNRDDYREYLEHLTKMLQGQKKTLVRVTDLKVINGEIRGLGLALDALAEWERQTTESEMPI